MSRRRTLVITGTRDGRYDVETALDAYASRFGTPYLILGGDKNGDKYTQRGVDLQAHTWGKLLGCPGIICYADWDNNPRGAGPERNGRMVAHARVGSDLLAFPGRLSKGTWDCFNQGELRKLHCVVVEPGLDWLDRLEKMSAKPELVF